MRAPDPKAWLLQQDELDAIECNLDIYGIESRALQDPIYAVARRRALEELRAIRDAYPEQTQALHDRIAEIEAEGE